jgi:hypothetical protein
VTIRLTLKEKGTAPDIEEMQKYGATPWDGPPNAKPDATLTSAPQWKSRDYQIRNLSIRPLETGHVSVEVLTPPGSEFVQWKPIAAKGFKSLWRGIARISGVPPVPSATAAPQASSAGPDEFDKLLAQAPPPEVTFKASEIPQQAQPVQSLPPLPKWHRIVDQPAPDAPASKSARILRQVPTSPPSVNPVPAEIPLSIKDAENAGLVRTSFRNPEGSSSGDSVLLVVVKIGGPDRLVLTIPPGLLLKSPLPASQDMIIAGLKGRDAGGGKYAPASTITLTDNQPARYVVEAYCAEFHKDNPPADKFDFGVGTPVEPGMVCVLNESRNQGLSVAGAQAAVWIHAGRLTFSEMNTRMSIGPTEWSRAEAVAARCASR